MGMRHLGELSRHTHGTVDGIWLELLVAKGPVTQTDHLLELRQHRRRIIGLDTHDQQTNRVCPNVHKGHGTCFSTGQ
jgi:hypothetical protein